MTSFKQPRKSRRSSLWQQYDAHEEDEYDETNGSPLLSRSSSTPYKLYTSRASAVGADEEGDETGSGSPFRRQQQQSTPRSSYSQVPHVPTAAFVQSHTPVRRKNASFGSPGMRASPSVQSMAAASGSPAPASGSLKKAGPRKARTSARFVRRKTFEQRVKELPSDLLDRAVSLGFTIAEHLADPTLGYPLGVTLHLFALVSHLISPTSELSLTLLAGLEPVPRRGGTLFADSRKRKGGLGATSELRRAVQQNRIDAWAWLAGSISCALIALSVYNAYHLVMARRKYRLWMRSPNDQVTSQNARLVPIHLDEEDQGPTWQDRVAVFLLQRLRDIPIIGWFTPDPPALGYDTTYEAQIHELNVWEAPEVSLRVAVIFSPVHAVLWHIAGTSLLPISGLAAWIVFFSALTAISAQSLLLSTSFTQLVKDRALLAAEMLKEYDQKFVLPRAMPNVRDASTMTTGEDFSASSASISSRGAPRHSDAYASRRDDLQRQQHFFHSSGVQRRGY